MSGTRLWLPAKRTLVSLQHESRRRLECDYRRVADHVVGIRPVGDWLERLVWEIEHATLAVSFVRAASKTGGEFDSEIRQAFDATGCDYLSLGVCAGPPANNLTTPSFTYPGTSPTQLVASTLGGSNRARAWLFKAVAPTTGTNDVVFTRTGSLGLHRVVITIAGYSGVDSTTPTGTALANNGDSNAPNVTPTAASGELVVDVVAIAGTGTLTVGSGQAPRANQSNASPNGVGAASDEAWSSGTTVSMTWSYSGGDEWGSCAVALKPSGGGGGTFGRLVGGSLTGGMLVGGLLTGS